MHFVPQTDLYLDSLLINGLTDTYTIPFGTIFDASFSLFLYLVTHYILLCSV